MSQYIVRSATVDDADQAAAVHLEAWRQEHQGMVPDDLILAMKAKVWARHRRARTADRALSVHWLVALDLSDGTVVGLADVGPYRFGPAWADVDRSVGEIYAIYVDPARWGRGLGRSLLDAAIERLVADRVRTILLWVLAKNWRGQRFYERCGFAPDGAVRTSPVGSRQHGYVDLREVRYALNIASHPPGHASR